MSISVLFFKRNIKKFFNIIFSLTFFILIFNFIIGFILNVTNNYKSDIVDNSNLYFMQIENKDLNYKFDNSILFAYSQKKAQYIIKNEIIKYIIIDYKKEYFANRLKDVNLEEHKKLALIKVLSMFDNNFDTLFVASELQLNEKLVLDSFIKFQLKDLLNKWNEIVELILNNSFYLFCSGTYNELLKFLLNTLDSKWNEVNVIINENDISIFDKDFKNCLLKNTDNVVLLTELIGFSPKIINLYCKNYVDNPVFQSIIDIFEDRVKIKSISNNKKSWQIFF